LHDEREAAPRGALRKHAAKVARRKRTKRKR
jgi:hypothetical protein